MSARRPRAESRRLALVATTLAAVGCAPASAPTDAPAIGDAGLTPDAPPFDAAISDPDAPGGLDAPTALVGRGRVSLQTGAAQVATIRFFGADGWFDPARGVRCRIEDIPPCAVFRCDVEVDTGSVNEHAGDVTLMVTG